MRIDDTVDEYYHTHLAIYNIVRYSGNRKLVKKFSTKISQEQENNTVLKVTLVQNNAIYNTEENKTTNGIFFLCERNGLCFKAQV
jgi:hypothetical protein